MMQYVPEQSIYVYFRYDENQTVMCIMNTGKKEKEISLLKQYIERTNGFTKAKDIITGEEKGSSFIVPAKKMFVLQLEK